MENQQETENMSVPPPVLPHTLSEDEFESCDEENVGNSENGENSENDENCENDENEENDENSENSVGASEASENDSESEDPTDSDPTITCQICYNKFGIYRVVFLKCRILR